jgi:hypothetical protein
MTHFLCAILGNGFPMIFCGDVLGPMISSGSASIKLSHLSLLKYSFNLNPAIHKQISIELGELMTDNELRICRNPSSALQSPQATNVLFDSVLQSQSILQKNEVVLRSKTDNLFLQLEQTINGKFVEYKNELGKFMISSSSNHEILNECSASSDDSTNKPLSEMSAIDVGYLLESLDLGEYKSTFLKNKIDGISLQHCEKVEDIKEGGIKIAMKARMLFNLVRKFQMNGVPVKYFNFFVCNEVSLNNLNTIA